MDDEQWTRAKHLLNNLLDAAPDDPAAWLDEQCDDPALRANVQSLFRAHEDGTLSAEDHASGWLAGAPEGEAGGPGPSLTGRRIGAYRLVEEIGVGGMSVVYRAERAAGDYEETVAVKVLQRRLHSGDAAQRFRAERQVLASLDHPHIAQLQDGGVTEGGRPYLVMEHVDGVPLTDYADAHDLELEARLDLLAQVFDAVAAAHRQLVVHRDLKPSNVLVTETESGPQVKLLDFGIAKLLDDSMPVTAPQTETGHHLLTPAYAAPEQVRGTDMSTRTDVYQLGVLAYELLAGTRPFDLWDKSLTEIERIVLENDPPPPSERAEATAEALQGDLDTILQKALRKEPERRYGSVEALAADVRRHRADEPIRARPATLGYRAKKFVRRHRWGVGVAAGFLVLLLTAGALLVQQRNQAQRNAQRAQREAETAEQVSQYLSSLFEEADPNFAQGDTVTARELLRLGTQRVGELDDQPAVQAQLAYVLGKTRRQLGLYDTTRALLERSLSLRRRLHGREHPDVADSMHELALLIRDQTGRYARAESLLTEAVAINRAVHGPQDSTVAAGLKDLVFLQRQQGKLDAAEASVREALSVQRALYGDEHVTVAESLFNLAAILRDRGQYEQAEDVQRRSLAMVRSLTDGPHPGVSANLNNLALVLEEQGRLEETEEALRQALKVNRTLFGSPHPEVANTVSNLASNLAEQGRYEAAVPHQRTALQLRRALHDGPHPLVAEQLHNLASLHGSRGRLAAADSAYRAAQRVYQQLGNTDRPSYALTLAQHGRLLRKQGSYAEAESLLKKALSVRRSLPETDSSRIQKLHSELATLYTDWNRPDWARKYEAASTRSP